MLLSRIIWKLADFPQESRGSQFFTAEQTSASYQLFSQLSIWGILPWHNQANPVENASRGSSTFPQIYGESTWIVFLEMLRRRKAPRASKRKAAPKMWRCGWLTELGFIVWHPQYAQHTAHTGPDSDPETSRTRHWCWCWVQTSHPASRHCLRLG